MGMMIGIITGAIIGGVLLIISFILFWIGKRKQEENRYALWMMLAGLLALITSGSNALTYFF
ncbi:MULTISPECIES: hypothetical protein [Lysinibacillus]|uniref:hypothetical protein n=1 Tax=Lysinibacillus TaxID=400634 RepID=UPI00056AACBB|nr:hypothetical protein [Lysinibacillus sphaericus]PIJ99257.1 hypothetical protein CTN02_05165 [Lysinibacillus sphaericus]QTB24194.1 hypothetical protein J1907_09155 [Lysinibacillus sphaericus]